MLEKGTAVSKVQELLSGRPPFEEGIIGSAIKLGKWDTFIKLQHMLTLSAPKVVLRMKDCQKPSDGYAG